MSWNRGESRETKPPASCGRVLFTKPEASFPWLLVVVAVVVAVAVWMCCRRERSDGGVVSPTVASAKAIVERKPNLAPKEDAPPVVTNVPSEETNRFGIAKTVWRQMSKEERVAIGQAKYDEEAAKIDSTYLARKKAHDAEIASRTFKFTSENMIADILSLQPGDSVLMFDLHEGLEADFIKSMEHEIVINDDDDEHTRLLKMEMRELKPQIMDAINRGEKLNDMLNEYRKEIAKAQLLRRDLLEELNAVKRKATSIEEVEAYVRAANELLRQKNAGSVTIPITKGTLRRIEINAENARLEGGQP